MSVWLLAAMVLTVALVPLVIVAVRLQAVEGLAALELAGLVVPVILLLLAQGTSRPAFADLAVVGVILSFAGSLVYVRFMELRR